MADRLLGSSDEVEPLWVEDDVEANVLDQRRALTFHDPWVVTDEGFGYSYPLCGLDELLPTYASEGRRLPLAVHAHPLRHVHHETSEVRAAKRDERMLPLFNRFELTFPSGPATVAD